MDFKKYLGKRVTFLLGKEKYSYVIGDVVNVTESTLELKNAIFSNFSKEFKRGEVDPKNVIGVFSDD